jgi:hypothetical protein
VGWVGLHDWIHTREYEDRTKNDQDEPEGKTNTDDQFFPDLSLINLWSLGALVVASLVCIKRVVNIIQDEPLCQFQAGCSHSPISDDLELPHEWSSTIQSPSEESQVRCVRLEVVLVCLEWISLLDL